MKKKKSLKITRQFQLDTAISDLFLKNIFPEEKKVLEIIVSRKGITPY